MEVSSSVVSGVNHVAEIFGRPALSRDAVGSYVKATGIKEEGLFMQRLFDLLKTKRKFPLPVDFAVPASSAIGFCPMCLSKSRPKLAKEGEHG